MTELSLTAQTVWHAFRDATNCAENKLAAALRAAADQVVIKLAGLGQESAWYLEEIAAELEAH